MNKIAMILPLALCLAPVAAMAEVGIAVRVGPPAPIVEHYGPAPHPGYVWIAGYQRWNGARYMWAPGYWAAPPRPRAVWIPPHWVHHRYGWVLIPGHWR